MSRISFRKFRSGDEEAINDLYFAVTGLRRTQAQFEWQWLSAPAGQGEMWLIEYEEDDGNKKLVGHHGLMPLYFSCGSRDLVAGKTENTMVLPEFRRKMLYPLLERKFLESYRHRFDLLFSTSGPAPAIRQRKAQGYTAKENWIHYRWGLGFGATISRLIYSMSLKRNKNLMLSVLEHCLKIPLLFCKTIAFATPQSKPTLQMEILTDHEAKSHPFFDDFWEKCRHQYAVTPRRYREDLTWRFWDNPNGEYITILFNLDDNKNAFAIVRKRCNTIYSLEDLICEKASPKIQTEIVENLCTWVFRQKGMVLEFATTSDSASKIKTFDAVRYPNILKKFPYSKKKNLHQPMMRKVCQERGNADERDLKNWYVTPYYFEGQ